MCGSWGADGAGIAVVLLISEHLFWKVAEDAALRLVSSIRDRFKAEPAPLDFELTVDRARQRVALRYGIEAAALQIVETVDGTDGVSVTFRADGVPGRFEVEVRAVAPTAQVTRCKRVYEAEDQS